jgi:hypothetical protein
MEDNSLDLALIVMYLLGVLVSMYIFYRVVRSAVYDGTEYLRSLIKQQNHLKKIELKKNGWSHEQIEQDLAKEGLRN